MATSLGRAVLVWLLLIAAEVVHGIVRTVWLAPVVGDFRARQIAVFSGSLLILLIVSVTVHWLQAPTTRALVVIGLLWAILTVGFETRFGMFILGYLWTRLASDYNLREGGLLPIGLLLMALSPWLATRIRRAARRRAIRVLDPIASA
jgi:hypothetical protein